jgi:signal transduction histidine kinase
MLKRPVTCLFLAIALLRPGPVLSQDDARHWRTWRDTALHDTTRLEAMDALIHSVRYDQDSALVLACLQEELALIGGHTRWRIRALQRQGEGLAHSGRIPEAINRYETVVALHRERADTAGVADGLRDIGGLLYKAGAFDQAMEKFIDALRIREARKDTSAMASILNSMGLLHMDHGDAQGALAYYERCLAIHIAAGDSVRAGVVLNNLGTPLRAMGRCDEAIPNHIRSLAIHERAGRKIGIAASLNHLAAAYNCKHEPYTALAYSARSLRIRESIGDTAGVAYAELQRAKAWLQLKDYRAVVRSAGIALRIGTKMVQIPIRKEASELLYEGYKGLSDWRKALEMRELNERIEDSLSGNEAKRAILRREYEYEYAKRALADSLERVHRADEERCAYDGRLMLEKERRGYLVGTVIAGTLVFALVAFLLVKRVQQARRSVRQEKALREKQVNELLQGQEITAMHAMFEGQEKERERMARDLHDRVGSMLGTVKMQMEVLEERMGTDQGAREDQYHKVYGLLVETVGEVRRISHDMVTGTLARFGLEKALEDLCASVRVRGGMAVELRVFGLEQRLEPAMEITLYRVLQELVGNALKHAKATELSINVTRSLGRLSVMVSDDGAGFDPSTPGDGMGLENVRKRAATLGGNVTIDTALGKGTTVSLECVVV